MIVNLPVDLLRSFVSIIDLGGYTRTAEHLGRTQPAISLQIKRLEGLLGVNLLDRSARDIVLTEAGQTLAVYARQILQLNDETVARFTGPAATGPLRIGLPTDFAVAFLQDVLIAFTGQHAEVDVEVHCDLSRRILEDLHDNRLDIAVAIIARNSQYLVRDWHEQPIWAAAEDFRLDRGGPVPLLTHPEGCEYRSRMTAALSRGGIDWRIAYSDPAIAGLQRAVLAGMGVTALTRKTLLAGMRTLGEDEGFPRLEQIRIGLFYKHARLSHAGLMLVNDLSAALKDAATGASN